ncbi:RNA helicase [Agrobacterium sp. FDAARGOS_525]|uniref:RNA helicase n=1 Tax=Agrobacterium sp. FDAARGOS_525 TaxID=2420311 RepID=UPI000F682A46|nr:RNA helicase [Agrobacterium sp. FDAARGOS_525]RSC31478.1 RNA helicase [Agrobacterium sp. FDAARGOS_525]
MNTKPVKNDTDNAPSGQRPYCGIIMPIAAMGKYEKSHWDRVRIILDEAIEEAGFQPRLVSESEDIGVIHARIVQNLYDDPIVVCDVSGKNANVMFELGLRLAFDKPTIVIKDDLTDYSFDTSPIEHINYRADLRFDDVRDFRKRLAAAMKGSVAQKEKDDTYSPFLGHFGKFKLTGLETKTVSSDQFIIEQLKSLQEQVTRLVSAQPTKDATNSRSLDQVLMRNSLKNMVVSLLQTQDFDLNDQVNLYKFFETLHLKMKERDIKMSDATFNNVVAPLIVEYRKGKSGSQSLV